MAAAGLGNPVGLVILNDFGTPHFIGGLARAETVSGGVFVFGSTATGVVSSGADTFATADILFTRDASGLLFNGVSLATAGSNQPITVLTQGVCVLVANGTCTGGGALMVDGNNSVADIGSTASSVAAGGGLKVGRALTGGASGGYVVVYVSA